MREKERQEENGRVGPVWNASGRWVGGVGSRNSFEVRLSKARRMVAVGEGAFEDAGQGADAGGGEGGQCGARRLHVTMQADL